MQSTIEKVLQSGSQYLSQRGIDEARHSMQSLLMHVLHCDKTWLYLHYQDPIDEEKLALLRPLLKQRGQGVPLQHLLGSVEFYRREFSTDARALIPRPETEELVELALQRCQAIEHMHVLDMGTGSGVIGITLALELAPYQPRVALVDVSEKALSLALQNATQLGAAVKTYRSELFSLWGEQEAQSSAVTPLDDFSLVLANLPYIPQGEEVSVEVQHDPASALYGGPDGLDIIRPFLDSLRSHLAPDALVILEVGHDQGIICRDMMEKLGYRNCEVLCDINGHARFPLGYAPLQEAKEEVAEVEEEA